MNGDEVVEYYLKSQNEISEEERKKSAGKNSVGKNSIGENSAGKESVDKNFVNGREFSASGKSVYVDNEYFRGCYWYYESDDFILDIHYFNVKKDYFMLELLDVKNSVFMISNYIILGNGEWYRPYKVIEPNSLLVLDANDVKNHYSLHPGPFFSVGVKFRDSMIEKYIVGGLKLSRPDISKLFYSVENDVKDALSELAAEILAFKESGVIAELFFESKAKEWLRITLEAYLEKSRQPLVSLEDQEAIKNVAKYIDDHFSYNIKQEFLEELAFMSGTKLKQTFKKQYKMSITEYTQRRRMNMAETFLTTTDLKIGDIAKAVGYSSQSRFTTLYKRYKGISPKDVRKISL